MAGTNNQSDSSIFHFPSRSSSRRWNVFLSFRGEDTRKNFTGHLYAALHQAGIRTFKDDPELQKGEEISSELLNAIDDAKLSIIVFSKKYASSRWCLDELVKILECKRTKGLTVLPVFYNVDPSDVRHQTGSFEQAFESHKRLFMADMEKVKKWQAALNEAANLSGYDLKNYANGHEAKLIQEIVKTVRLLVYPKDLNVVDHLVGIDSRITNMMPKLSIGSNDVRFIGIYGMGGIGKTTIAKAIYNKLLKGFESSCFLRNVREISEQPNGLVRLQNQLIYEILNMNKKNSVANVDEGATLMEEIFHSKRVLIVLDDLDQSSQLRSLAGHCKWFGPGSRIIITTRDERLLDQFEIDVRYKVEELSKDESLELLGYHAFRRTIPLEDFMELSERIVCYTGGLPLALEILGSSLFRRTKIEWKSTLEKLQQIPHNQIQKILKISYDALDDDKEKEIFLDIAFFFIGMDKDDVINILNSCGFFADIGIRILQERCLLTIDGKNKLRMHDLIRDMGKEIVRGESIKEPGKRSRLWYQGDVCHVLEKHKGSKTIEGVILDITTSMQKQFDTKTFGKMPNLRLLQINNAHLTGSFENSFEELRWLCWQSCPLTCLPSSFQPPKLVSLDMQYSNVNTLWQGAKLLKSLKILNVSHSQRLITTPDFEGVKMLEKLSLRGCSSLSQVHPSIGLLGMLVHLDLNKCYNLKCLPEQLGSLQCLKKLNASDTAIEQLPDSIGRLGKLVELNLVRCKSLRNLPSSICNLSSLEDLSLYCCLNLERLPEQLGNMQCLRWLNACDTAIKQLPDSIGCLAKLVELKLERCKNLSSLPSSMCNLRSLESLCLIESWDLEYLPEQLGYMECLTNLTLSGSAIEQLPDSVKLLKNLTSLSLRRNDMSDYSLLEKSYLDSCSTTEGAILNEIWSLSSLRSLNLGKNSFVSLPYSLSQLFNLTVLELYDCTSLRSLPELPPNILFLALSNCRSLRLLPDLPPKLKLLHANGCTSLEKLTNLSTLNELYRLDLTNCSNLKFTINASFLQVRSELDRYNLYLPSRDIPHWFSHQRMGSSVSFDMPLEAENNFLGMAMWVVYVVRKAYSDIRVVISNKTDGTEWYCEDWARTTEVHSWVRYIGKPSLLKSGDRIEVSFKGVKSENVRVERCGVHLLYNPDITKNYHKKGRDIDTEETSCYSKRLKL